MNRPFLATCCAVLLASAACSSANGGDAKATEPASGTNRDDAPLPTGNVANGMALADENGCAVCHGSDYGGVGFNPNLTPDAQFGLATWSDTQVATAIRHGVAHDGTTLCAIMERFPFSDQEAADVVAFLRSIPAVTRANAAACPGHGGSAP